MRSPGPGGMASVILELLFDSARQTGATLVTVTHDHGLLPGFERVVDFADFEGTP